MILATYGVTRHAAAVRINRLNEAAFFEFAQAEIQLVNQARIARGQEPAGWDFPDYVATLHKHLIRGDGISGEYIHEMILRLAGAGMLTAVAVFLDQTKK